MTTTAPLRRPDRTDRPADQLPADPSSAALRFDRDVRRIPELRSFARTFVLRTRPGRAAHLADVLLVVTELATNVVRHTEGPGLLTLTARADGTEVTVGDGSRRLPVIRLSSPGGLSGRGLVLVAAVCERLDVTLDPGAGKTLRATLTDRPPVARATSRPEGRTRTW
ncbi:ATP-binding protein [Kitasatospora sp. NPDC101176]|uniref:ATP-binding protein n=1 Tax=Kitasatospora sp. NPDC101176 TaxID=3364099 RepID=UPI00382FBBA2